MTNIVVYRTSFEWELDIMREGLSRAHFPCIVQTESLSGVTTGLDVSPAQGFGRRWLVLVPDQMKDQAKEIITSLHVGYDADAPYFPSMNLQAMKKTLWIAGRVAVMLIVFLIWIYVSR